MKRNEQQSDIKRPPVLLLHGMFQTGEAFLAKGLSEKSIAFQTLDYGYDVWLGNNRGQRYSSNWENIDFEWVDMGENDLPAMIDKVLEVTRFNKLHFIGYDQGGTQMISAMANDNDYYAEKVDVFAGLAPCTTMKNTKN